MEATNQPLPPDLDATPAALQRQAWECCCAFGLAVLARPPTQQPPKDAAGGAPPLVRRDLVWTSNLHEDRFDNQVRAQLVLA